jgi:hypothetical protein
MTACLARSSSPLRSTTHSRANGDFLKARELPHIWRASLLRAGLRRDRVVRNIVVLVEKSLAAKSRFLGNGDGEGGDSVRMRPLRRGQAKHAVLARPLGGQLAKPRHAHAMRQAALDGGLDEIGGEEGE